MCTSKKYGEEELTNWLKERAQSLLSPLLRTIVSIRNDLFKFLLLTDVVLIFGNGALALSIGAFPTLILAIMLLVFNLLVILIYKNYSKK